MQKEVFSKPGQHIPRSVSSIYTLGFFLSLHVALPAYLFSSFLSQFFPEKYIGIIFSIASLLTIWLFSKLPAILRRFGNFVTAGVFLTCTIVAIALLSFIKLPFLVIVIFILYQLATSVLTFNFDIFLEHSSGNKVTGEIRGTYLMFGSIAWVIAEVLLVFIIANNQYNTVFIVASLVALPMMVILNRFKRFHDPHYRALQILTLFKKTSGHSKEVISIYIINFLLCFFYSWMVIYTPLYLYNYVGFQWNQIAILFAVMLLPFALIQRPLWKLADRKFGEKEFLIGGFSIMAIATGVMSFLPTPEFWIWMGLLFVSRIGAATTEVMSETYFFKHVHDSDVALIGIFRTTRPWAYIVAPIVATVLLPFSGIQYLFIILAVIMLYGVFKSFQLVDTR